MIYKLALFYFLNELNELKDIFKKIKQEKKKEKMLNKMKQAVEQSENYIDPKDYMRARQPKIYMRRIGR